MTEGLTTDVLVIGGGMAGAWAAAGAARAGARAVLIDKGYCGTSGVTAAAGPGHWWVAPEGREAAVAARLAAGAGLGRGAWMHRILETTWDLLPTLTAHYRFPRDESGRINYRAVRGPEYMRALRAQIDALGVRVLDHHPALELLARPDGSIGGARGARRPSGEAWEVHAGAVVLATGGAAFLSGLLGAGNNTGDGYLMAAEAGAALSGMEFTATFTIAPARTNMTRTMAYSFADYFDEAGRQLDAPPYGPAQMRFLARAMQQGKVLCSLRRLPEDIKARLHTISPNVPLVFERLGVDPYRDRFEVTLHTDGTVRGLGGVEVEDVTGRTVVPGLYAVGDTASRENVAGAISGGGNVNSAWALSSGWLAGHAAAAAARGARAAPLRPLGRAGLRPAGAPRPVDLAAARAIVRHEMQDYDRALFRNGEGLRVSRAALDAAWRELSDHADAHDPKARETAALLAASRASVAAALARRETRGMHLRTDAPGLDSGLAHRLRIEDLETLVVSPEVAMREAVA